MSKLKAINSRIKAVKSTIKITKTMQMIASAKLIKYKNLSNLSADFLNKMFIIVNKVKKQKQNFDNVNINFKIEKILLIAISASKGLCGSMNTIVSNYTIKYISQLKQQNIKIDFIGIGKRMKDVFSKESYFSNSSFIDNLNENNIAKFSKELSSNVIQLYNTGKISQCVIIYTKPENRATCIATNEIIFPIQHKTETSINAKDNFIIDNDINTIIETSDKIFLEAQIYNSLIVSLFSENQSRMIAMDNAVKNANELITKLVLNYNKFRQSMITAELIDIVSGAEII